VSADECRRGFDVADPIITSLSVDSAVYGDFDEDGLVDVAWSTFYGDWRVALNRGNGVFAPLPSVPGSFPGNRRKLAAAADVNRDGHLDLIFTFDGSFGTTFGDGHGGFGAMIISSGSGPQQKWLFDINHDGIPDFIESLDANRFRVALGTTDGKFTEGPIVVLYDGPSVVYGQIIAGDFDGDGFIDVAHVDGGFSGSTWEVVYAWGTADPAKFIVKVNLAGKVDLSSTVTVADVDGDGLADIVGGHKDALHVVRSVKRVTTSAILAVPGMTVINSLYRRDINGDGRADLIFGRTDATVGVALGNSNGGLASAAFASLPGSTGFTFADIYGDGAVNIVATGGQQGLRMIAGTAFGTGFSGASRVLPVDDLGRTNRTQVYDVDGDGHDDIIMSDIESPEVEVLTAKRYADVNASIRAIVGDFDGNGSADLALSSGYAQVLPSTIEFDNDRGVFGPASMVVGVDEFIGLLRMGPKVAPALFARRGTDLGILRVSPGRNAQFTVVAASTAGAVIADVDGDGVDELIVSGGNLLHILKGPDTPWREVATVSCFFYPYKIVAADLNADGRTDLVVAFENSYMVALLQADGSYSTTSYQGWGSVADIAVTDFDRDGVPDLLVSTSKSFGDPGYLQIVRGTGDGKFEPYATALINQSVGALILMDVDGDGWDDVVGGNGSAIEIVRSACVTPRVRVTAIPGTLKAGQQTTLVVHALSTDGFAVGLVTIREGGTVLRTVQPFDLATTSWVTPPLTAGVHTYDIEYSDQFAGISHTTISITAAASPPRHRAVH
jgi:hypothetical protein